MISGFTKTWKQILNICLLIGLLVGLRPFSPSLPCCPGCPDVVPILPHFSCNLCSLEQLWNRVIAVFIPFIPTLSCHPFICDHTSFVLALIIPPSPSPFIRLYMLLCLHPPARATLFALLVLGKLSVSSVPALVHKTPTFLLLLLSSSRFCMCARVRGARHCVRANGLKGNAYVIANCLQSLGAALKKDMPRRQLRLFAFASLSDCICFKGFVRIIFNPTALWALCTMASGKIHN